MLKHLRGKHDQRDHGRRAIGGGGAAQAAGLLPPEVQARIAERKPGTLEIVNDVARNLSATLPPSQVANVLKDLMKGFKEEIKELTRRHNKLRKSGEDLQEVQNKLLYAVLYHEASREKHNEFLSIARAERERVAKERQATSRQQRRKQRGPKPTLPPKPDTTTSFESLDEVGLLGWKRQRPDNPPDYTDYDPESFMQRPGAVRKLERTPENKPVRIMPSAGALEQTQTSSLSVDDYTYAKIMLSDEARIVADTDIFKHQGESNEDFWSARSSGSEPTVSGSVAQYASESYKVINGMLRGNLRSENMTEEQKKNAPFLLRVAAGLDFGMRPAPETAMVRRGIDDEVFQRMQEHLRVGDRFTDAAFASASVTPTFRWVTGKNTMNVILTEGTPALWTDKKTRFPTETEIIIGRGTTFEVVSMDAERGVILRTIPPDGEYTPPPLPPTP